MIPDWLNTFNAFAWVASNVIIMYVSVILIVFVIGYYILFDPRATTGGKFIFRFVMSLMGVIGLVCISLFLNPSTGGVWYEYPTDVLFWRPVVRLIAYSYVAYSVTALTILLIVRKWKPSMLRTAPDRDLVAPRKFD